MNSTQSTPASFFYWIGSVLMVGYILVVGRNVILPVVIAVIAVFVLVRVVDWLSNLPVLKLLPSWALHVVVLATAVAAVSLLGLVIAVTLEQMTDRAPTYQANIETLLKNSSAVFGLTDEASWQDIRSVTLGRIDLASFVGRAFSSLSSFGGSVFLIIVYCAFLLSEFANLPAKMRSAFRQKGEAARMLGFVEEISGKVSDYLSAKTGVNIVLGVVSFVILWLFGVDFAVFWAITIALLNYVPYIGSAIGVAMPAILSVAQFGDLWTTATLTAGLAAAQVFVGNVLEPRWIGRQLNLSPFSIILSLAIWSSIWGIAGAILAAPLTSVLMIVFREIPATQPLANLIADVPAGQDSEEQETRSA